MPSPYRVDQCDVFLALRTADVDVVCSDEAEVEEHTPASSPAGRRTRILLRQLRNPRRSLRSRSPPLSHRDLTRIRPWGRRRLHLVGPVFSAISIGLGSATNRRQPSIEPGVWIEPGGCQT